MLVTDSTFSANSANEGGAIVNDGGSVTLTNCTVSGNTAAAGSGGGIENSGHLILQNTVVAGNAASGTGPDLDNSGGTLSTNYVVSNTSNDSTWMGSLPYEVAQADSDTTSTTIAINFDSDTFAIPQTIVLAGTLDLHTGGAPITIEGPAAALTIQGGGSGSNFSVFTVAGNTTATIENLTISNGYTNGYGGGINNSGTLAVSNSTLAGNCAAAGGALYSDGNLTLTNTILSDNQAVGLPGGDGSIFAPGETGGNGQGGGVFVAGGILNMTDVSVLSNAALGGQGGNAGDGAEGGSGGLGEGGGLYVGGRDRYSDCRQLR